MRQDKQALVEDESLIRKIRYNIEILPYYTLVLRSNIQIPDVQAPAKSEIVIKLFLRILKKNWWTLESIELLAWL